MLPHAIYNWDVGTKDIIIRNHAHSFLSLNQTSMNEVLTMLLYCENCETRLIICIIHMSNQNYNESSGIYKLYTSLIFTYCDLVSFMLNTVCIRKKSTNVEVLLIILKTFYISFYFDYLFIFIIDIFYYY